jgi:hypothetical protein
LLFNIQSCEATLDTLHQHKGIFGVGRWISIFYIFFYTATLR